MAEQKVKEGIVIPENMKHGIGENLIKYKMAGETFDSAISKIESDLRCQISQMVVNIYRQEWERI